MVYHGTEVSERIMVHPFDGLQETHYIEMTKSADENVFTVTSCCGNDWEHEFYMGNISDYERVKFGIMNCIDECDTMEELLVVLDEMFHDEFGGILIVEECDRDCEHCSRMD